MSEARERSDAVFAATRWSLVARARGGSPDARMALSDLCAAYYRPVEVFIGRQVSNGEEAKDLTQEFFSRLLSGSGVGGADPGKGRFRSYVLGAVKHFLQTERIRRSAAKRGAGAEHVPLDLEVGSAPGLQVVDPVAETADIAFDREWAHALLGRVLERLGKEMAAEGKQRQFEVLKPCLLGASAPPPQSDLGAALKLGESAVKVAIHRLRRRFREGVRAEIAETLTEGASVDEEMRHLVQALGGHG